jgi:hypothetical protein
VEVKVELKDMFYITFGEYGPLVMNQAGQANIPNGLVGKLGAGKFSDNEQYLTSKSYRVELFKQFFAQKFKDYTAGFLNFVAFLIEREIPTRLVLEWSFGADFDLVDFIVFLNTKLREFESEALIPETLKAFKAGATAEEVVALRATLDKGISVVCSQGGINGPGAFYTK